MTERTKKEESPVLDDEQVAGGLNEKFLVLHNDEEHSFDYVIESLIEICDHSPEQAEQCTYIVHYKGKCDVKKGAGSYLRPFRTALVEKGLKATIE